MEKQLVKLPEEFQETVKGAGLELTKAQTIAMGYVPFMNELQEQMDKLNKLKKEDPTNAEAFGRIRKDLGKLKSKVNDKKDEDKKLIKIEGNLIQGLRNTVYNSAVLTQEEAKEYEERELRLEQQKLELLATERKARLSAYVEDVESIDIDFGTMEEEIFEAYLAKKESDHFDLIEAQKKAEEERLERERVEALHNQRKESLLNVWSFLSDDIKSANLGGLSEEVYNKTLEDATKASEEEKARLKKLEEEAKALKEEQEKVEKERLALEVKVRNRVSRFEDVVWDGLTLKSREDKSELANLEFLQTSSEEDFNKVLSDWEKVVAARKEEERKAEEKRKEELAKIEAEKKKQEALLIEQEEKQKAPDKDKLTSLAQDLANYELPQVNSDAAKHTIEGVRDLLTKTSQYILDCVKTM